MIVFEKSETAKIYNANNLSLGSHIAGPQRIPEVKRRASTVSVVTARSLRLVRGNAAFPCCQFSLFLRICKFYFPNCSHSKITKMKDILILLVKWNYGESNNRAIGEQPGATTHHFIDPLSSEQPATNRSFGNPCILGISSLEITAPEFGSEIFWL